MTSITDTQFRERAREAVLDVLTGLGAMTDDPHENRVTFGELLTGVDSRYHLELRGVLEGLMSAGVVLRTTTHDGDRYSLIRRTSPAEERLNVRRFLFEAHRQGVAEYNEVGGMNDPWDLVCRLEADGHDMAAVGRLLLAEFLDGGMDPRNVVHLSVSTTPRTPVTSRE